MERIGEAFAGIELLTIMGKQLRRGDPAPDFCLDYLDLADLAVHTVGLADSTGLVRLLNGSIQSDSSENWRYEATHDAFLDSND